MNISIIAGFRNRDTERVKRYLDSLQNQSNSNFELLFVDYGSDTEVSEEIRLLTSKYNFCNYIYNDTRGWPWNRSHALNTGLKVATGEYVLFSDIDLIYSSDFITTLLKYADPKKQLFKQFYLLPNKYNYQTASIKIEENFGITAYGTKGAIHLVSREELLHINGFDEFYCFWGLEDNDLFSRLYQQGLKEEWIPLEESPVYHQWHPIVSNQRPFFFPDKWYEQMQLHFHLNKKNIVRNSAGNWGEIFNENSRELYKRDVEKPISLPDNIVLNTKSEILKLIIESVTELKDGEFISINIPIPVKPNKYLENSISSFITKISNVLLKGTANVNNSYIKYIERLSIQNKAYLIPEIDLYFIIWQLIKFENVISDYSLEIKSENIKFELC